MIRRFRHKGLERFHRDGDARGIDTKHAARLRVLLTALAAATCPEQMGRLPGARLHPLKGERKGRWALSVSGNWRLVFEFEGEDATNVDLIDYH
ncbi:MAG TPA: type II toxin-antitoxin system RelE/ParE family toxin [Rhizomicrobium sp.]|jgi:proteic killer suppression protein|nr:type II toxin-antitoxin system RelE/ParE family toxin [Rhizomicrobium sp.]